MDRAELDRLADVSGAGMPAELQPRHLLVRVAQVAAAILLVAIAVGSLPGLDDIEQRIMGAHSGWLAAVALAELGSCAGYVLVFRATFCASMSWRLSYDIAMSELAANSLLPAGGAGGLALGVWALRQAGMPTGHIARRTVAFFVVTSAANFAAVIVAGLATFAGVLPGSGDARLTLLPAAVTIVATVLVVGSPQLLRALGGLDDEGGEVGRHVVAALGKGLGAAADGVEQAVALLRSRSAGVVAGSFAYMAADLAALGFAFAAIGHAPPLGTLALGYLIGQLGNLVPLPGGIGGTEGALTAVFALYGVDVTDALSAVLLYRLFQLALPALLGAPAFVLLRRRLMRADEPALVCAPMALEIVRVPLRR